MRRTDKNIRETYIIDPACRERFVPTTQPMLCDVRARGIGFSGVSELSGAYRIQRVSYPHHLFLYTLEGSGWLETPEGRVSLEPGTVWISPAHSPHHYGITKAIWRICWVSLDDQPYARRLRAMTSSVHRSDAAPQITAVLEALLSEAHAGDASRKVPRLYAELLFELLSREIDRCAGTGQDAASLRLRRLFESVFSQLHHPWDVPTLARKSGLRVTPDHFHRLCIKYLGEPPMRILCRRRLEHAAELLRDTSHTLQAIAELCGYSTAFALSAAFKRHFGVSPRAFRRKTQPA
jgi:AraC-like DNA-binding protein